MPETPLVDLPHWPSGLLLGECYDCGRRYDSPGWIDAIVPDEIWEKISPIEVEGWKGGGLLCVCCIAKRCELLGLSNVPVKLNSGPLTMEPSDA